MHEECENPECRSIATQELEFGQRFDMLEDVTPSERICTTANLCAHCAESATRNWTDDRVNGFVRAPDGKAVTAYMNAASNPNATRLSVLARRFDSRKSILRMAIDMDHSGHDILTPIHMDPRQDGIAPE